MAKYNWRNAIGRFETKSKLAIIDAQKELGKETRTQVAEATPKVSGRAAASWNVSVNVADKAVKPKSYDNPSGAVHDGNVNVDKALLGDVIVINNSLPYIEQLNSGRSDLAPAGFIEIAKANASSKLPKIVRKSKLKYGL